jgi:hypothetical protein
MRRIPIQNPFSVLFAFYLLGFGAFFFYAIFTFPAALSSPDGLLPLFQWPFIWNRSFILFMDYAIPISVAAVAVSYSLFRGRGLAPRPGARSPFSRLVSSHLVTLITLAVIYSVLLLGVYPRSWARLESLRSLTRLAVTYRQQADAAFQGGDSASALQGYQHYLAIDEGNLEVIDRVVALQKEQAGARAPAPQAEAEAAQLHLQKLAGGRTAAQLLALADGYYRREDYFSAHYYASLANRIDPSRKDAQRLAAEAWDKIGSKDLSKLQEQQKALYQSKTLGYRYFDRGEYLKAYYAFLQLRAQYPDDADVNTFLAKSALELRDQVFFLEEAGKIDSMPGVQNVLFLNDPGEGQREVVYVGKAATLDEGTFLKDIEVLRFAAGGELLYHYLAPYGHYQPPSTASQGSPGGQVNLHGVQRSSAGPESVPRYLAGSARGAGVDLPYTLVLRPTLEELSWLSPGRQTAQGRGFLTLWRSRSRIEAYGYAEPFVSAELLRRVSLPFDFLVLSLLALVLGWRYRAHLYGRGHWLFWVSVPLFPLAAAPLFKLYLQGQGVLNNFLLLRLGFGVTLTVLLALQGGLLFLMLVLLAGQSAE